MEGYVIMDTDAREPAAHIILKIRNITSYSGIAISWTSKGNENSFDQDELGLWKV